MEFSPSLISHQASVDVKQYLLLLCVLTRWDFNFCIRSSPLREEIKCYHKILHISYKEHVANEEVCAKIQRAIGPHEDVLIIVKRRKVQWYGHVSRSSGVAKTILHGMVKGGRRQGRQKKRLEDKSENGQAWSSRSPRGQWRTEKNWRKLVVKSSVVPQRPSRLRD